MPSATPLATGQHLTFTLGAELFGMSTGYIREILQFSSMTSVPLTPDFVRGVLNVRGAVVPVIDLSLRFARGPTEVGKKTCVVILEVPRGDERVVLGVLVDQVNEVREIAQADVEPAPAFGAALDERFVQGIAHRDQGFLILLDVPYMLDPHELSGLAGIGPTAQA